MILTNNRKSRAKPRPATEFNPYRKKKRGMKITAANITDLKFLCAFR